MRKKDATTEGASEWSSAPVERITPLDVQQKEFRVTRVGAGYRMREVDEFLDQVTDALSALIAENERLLQRTGSTGRDASTPAAPPATATDAADRGAVEAFLRREKGFLEDLGGLVQAHAEELRSMVRAARRDTTSPAAAAPGSAEQPPTEATEPADEGEPAPNTPHHDDDEDTATATATTGVGADEPIRIEDPEPARSRRSDEDEGDSLRELFWGEE
jgi:DivIVA domain-containing protein